MSTRSKATDNQFLQVMEKRIDTETNLFKSLLLESQARHEKQIDSLKSLLIEFENRLFTDLDERMLVLKREINVVTERVTKLETVSSEILAIKNEIKTLKMQTLKNANSVVACDLRVNGVPYSDKENLTQIFENICTAINITTPRIKSIYRLHNKNNKAKEASPDAVIIVKMLSPYDKNFFLKSLGLYKKANNTNLKLNVLGFQSDRVFHVNENLTGSNYRILREAILLKKRKLVHSAYTFRGLVYVKHSKDDDPVCIDQVEGLDFFRGQNSSSYTHEDFAN